MHTSKIRTLVAVTAVMILATCLVLTISIRNELVVANSALAGANNRMQQELTTLAQQIAVIEESYRTAESHSANLESASLEVADSIRKRSRLNLGQNENSAAALEKSQLAALTPSNPVPAKWSESMFANLVSRLTRIEMNGAKLRHNIRVLADKIVSREDFMAAMPLMIPTQGRLSSRFGDRVSPIKGTSQLHKGLDIAAPRGTKIFAPADGTIRFSGRYGSFGRYISIVHGHGFVTKYAHLDEYFVKSGEQVQRGDLIGTVGNTGKTTGPHLHYEVLFNDQPVNPERFILPTLFEEVLGHADDNGGASHNTSL